MALDIRQRCDAPAARLEPNVDRLLAALDGGKLDRVPHFELLMDPRIVGEILDWPAERACGSFALPPEDYLELSRRTAQDAIVVNLNVWAGGMGAVSSLEDLEAVPDPDVRAFRESARRAFEVVSGTNVGVIGHAGGPLFASYCVCGPVAIQSFMLDLYDNPVFVTRLLDWHADWQMAILEAVADLPFAAVFLADDLCDNTGFLFRPETVETLWLPRISPLVGQIKSTGTALCFHCCGDVSPLLPLLDEMGVDAVQPLQPACNDIVAVRRQWGRRFCLMGNLNVEGVLAFGSPDEVRRAGRELIAQVGDDGAFVLASSHSIVDAIPTENYFALVDTAVRYG